MKLFIAIISLNFFVNANEKNPFQERPTENLRPHIVDHPNPGCPTNAECSPAAGILLAKFKKHLKKQDWKALAAMQKKEGIPVDLWSQLNLDKPGNDPLLISWDSPCLNHQKAKPHPINLSLSFMKDLSALKKKKYLVSRKILLADKEKIQVINGPREGSPLYFSKRGTHYIRDMDGYYYDLLVTPKGKLIISASQAPEYYPKTIQCSEKLVEQAKKLIATQYLYKGLFCQQIWNKDKKSYQTIVQGHSCL